ncbi:iron uptake transporter permease EfeU [Actinocatenispora rupis]|uniref:Iron permease n=1 Tax=Actinocatenispora rupis TaxID=519421 RepID=A0A8J3JE04_9ACTN|nr:iron uptake transporter permease EfeU [Actinocatenispora rupis]GID13083.1 iron permease [Actinocatenispora rupis]
MIPTLVIGLREGLEASLIVGIIAAFLGRNGRRDALRQVWIGVLAAVVLCLAIGTGLVVLSHELPQQAQEGMETVIGLFAVVMVTFMILWMAKHSRGMKRELEGAASAALARGSARALVVMAFLAVLREGFETSVFLVSVLQNSGSVLSASIGAVLGIAIAVGIGYGIYRGGVRLNMARFFKITGLVLVLVAAGLVMTALHTAHEAGWLNVGQATALDLSWLVQPGTVLESLFTGVLGWQPQPTVVELVGYLVYAVPMLVYVAWPRRRRTPAKTPAPAPEQSPVDA